MEDPKSIVAITISFSLTDTDVLPRVSDHDHDEDFGCKEGEPLAFGKIFSMAANVD